MNLLFMQNGLAPYGIPRNGLVALYDPWRDTYCRNIVEKEPTSLSDFGIFGEVTWDGGVVFGDNSLARFAYISVNNICIGATYYLSLDVRMDDNSRPVLGVTGDLGIIIAGSGAGILLSVDDLGNGIYRIKTMVVATSTTSYFGIIKNSTKTAKTFKVIGNWQVNLGQLYPYSPPAGLPQSLTDFTGRGNNAQLGSAAGADTNDPAWSGNGLVFGTDDYCKSASPAFDDMQAFTCITVCKANSAGGGYLGRLFDKGYKYAAYNGKVRCIVSKQVGSDTWQGDTTTVAFGTPFVNATMYDLGTVNMFVNGIKQSMINLTGGTGSISSDASVDLYIGNISSATRNFDGAIYLQLWYNRVLSDAEYMQAYNGLRRLMSARGVVI